MISLTLHPCRRPLITFTDLEDPQDRELLFVQISTRLATVQCRGNQNSAAYKKQRALQEIMLSLQAHAHFDIAEKIEDDEDWKSSDSFKKPGDESTHLHAAKWAEDHCNEMDPMTRKRCFPDWNTTPPA